MLPTWCRKPSSLGRPKAISSGPLQGKGWLFTTLHRLFLQSQRRFVRFPHLEITEADADLPQVEPERFNRLDAQAAARIARPGGSAIPGGGGLVLPRRLFLCEIAGILEVPLGTVKSRIARGLAQLKHWCCARRRRPRPQKEGRMTPARPKRFSCFIGRERPTRRTRRSSRSRRSWPGRTRTWRAGLSDTVLSKAPCAPNSGRSEVPAHLKAALLAQQNVVRPTIWWQRPRLAPGGCGGGSLARHRSLWLKPASPDRFANFQARMVSTALREYRMDLVTNDMRELRQYHRGQGRALPGIK